MAAPERSLSIRSTLRAVIKDTVRCPNRERGERSRYISPVHVGPHDKGERETNSEDVFFCDGDQERSPAVT